MLCDNVLKLTFAIYYPTIGMHVHERMKTAITPQYMYDEVLRTNINNFAHFSYTHKDSDCWAS